ncbi:MAG: helix-turn-helix domain-containing protein [Anaerorhabdus sp.]|uniref:helix-turn-helix domain-containing protein n=1 Tax=Anaerorhabdus sp. TaxID=1872524 RepID=UPI003A8837F0
MRINEIISTKRKELGFTQEQVATYLNVSTPAVNKWESGKSFPDISLLPALARLLKTDLNTLLSFQEDLSDLEIATFANELGDDIFKNEFVSIYEKAIAKIREFPNNDRLKYTLVTILLGAINFNEPSNKEEYLSELNELLIQCVDSKDLQISNFPLHMLAINACRAENYQEAEEYLNKIVDFSIDKEVLEVTILSNEKKYDEALEKLETKVLAEAVKTQNLMMQSVNLLAEVERYEEAEYFFNTLMKYTECFNLMPTNAYLAEYRIAVKKQDKTRAIAAFTKVIENMTKPWNLEGSILYANVKFKENSLFSNNQIKAIISTLEKDEELAFIRDTPEFKEIMEKFK